MEIEDRDYQRPNEVLMPAFLAEDAQRFQPLALSRALDAILVLQVVVQRAIGKAQLEALHHLR